MSPSIRTFLLINLLLSVTLITSLAIIGNLFLAHRDIQSQLDLELIRSSTQLGSLINNAPSLNADKVKQAILTSFQAPIRPIANSTNPALQQALREMDRQTLFQIWDANNHLILRSNNAPVEILANNAPGFSTRWIEEESWRIYTSKDPSGRFILVLGEQSSFREHLENQLTQDSIFIMLITYPFLGVLIWLIVGRGLDPLRKIADSLHKRIPFNLQPLQVEAVPSEIDPLMNELNNLFTRLQETFEREKRFAGDAAHELRTPLAALKTQVQVALYAQTEEERRASLKKIIEGVDRSTHVVQQLLTLSRMMPDAGINEPEKIDLNVKAAELISILAQEALNKDITLELVAAPLPAYI